MGDYQDQITIYMGPRTSENSRYYANGFTFIIGEDDPEYDDFHELNGLGIINFVTDADNFNKLRESEEDVSTQLDLFSQRWAYTLVVIKETYLKYVAESELKLCPSYNGDFEMFAENIGALKSSGAVNWDWKVKILTFKRELYPLEKMPVKEQNNRVIQVPVKKINSFKKRRKS